MTCSARKKRLSACSRAMFAFVLLAFASSAAVPPDAQASEPDVVLYASDATVIKGHWTLAAATDAAGGKKLSSTNTGWSTPNAALAAPAHYFEFSFNAPSFTTYRVWLRLRGLSNSKLNESVWVQFSDAINPQGSAVYRTGTANGLLVNLERCKDCGISNWGWQNGAYWLTQTTEVMFGAAGTHTLRVQTREDGAEIDQIVLSPATFRAAAPGNLLNDTTIVPKAATVVTATPVASSSTPYGGAAPQLPGTVEARRFDDGGEGLAYHDGTAGNTGGSYRQGDVDLQASNEGGHNVGWTGPGEWLKYTVNVAQSGAYKLRLRVASPNTGATIGVALDKSNVSTTVTSPNTGGWQTWGNVEVPVTLAAGQQVMTITFPQGGLNLLKVTAELSTTSSTSPTPTPTPAATGSFRMMTWNIQHGDTKAGVYDPAAQARFIASQNPDVVALQEVQTWDENQPEKYKQLLEQITGQTWYMQWAPVIDKAGTEGNVLLSRLPVLTSTYHQMHATSDWTAMYVNRSAAQMTVLVNGVSVHVFSTHLDYYSTTARTAQLNDLMAWSKQFGNRRIVGGDFNSWWGESWIKTMSTEHTDTWKDVTGSNENGYTVNGAVRFDYLFRSIAGAANITPTKVSVPTTTLSDHYPVIADYKVTP